MKKIAAVWALFALLFSVGCSEETPVDLEGYLTARPIYFSANPTGTYQIYKYQAGAVQQITNDPVYHHTNFKIHPAGDKFLCLRTPATGSSGNLAAASLWRFDISGANPIELIASGDYNWSALGFPSYNIDGGLIALSARTFDLDAGADQWHIFVVDSLGGTPRRLSSRVGMFYAPVFSPEGNRIAYSAYPLDVTEPFTYDPRFSLEIFTAQVDTSSGGRLLNEQQLTDNAFWETDFAYNSTGSTIAYSMAEDQLRLTEKVGLYTIRKDGEEQKEIKRDFWANYGASWSPDNQYLFFSRIEFSSRYRIYFITATGGNFQLVYEGEEGNNIHPFINKQ